MNVFAHVCAQQMAEKAGEYMSNHGLKFIRPAIPTKVCVCMYVRIMCV